MKCSARSVACSHRGYRTQHAPHRTLLSSDKLKRTTQHHINKVFFIISEQLGRIVEGITMIYDVEGLGLKHLWKPAIETFGEVHRPGNRLVAGRHHPVNVLLRHQILQMFEENYPEGLKRLFVIKGDSDIYPYWFKISVFYSVFFPPAAPKIFPVAYNLVKHFLSENTRQKIFVLGGEMLCTFLYFKNSAELSLSDCCASGWQPTGRRFYWGTLMPRSCLWSTGVNWRIPMEILAVEHGWVGKQAPQAGLDRCFQSKGGLMSWQSSL